MSEWRPVSTLPSDAGKVLLALYTPTNWAYWVVMAIFLKTDTLRMREVKLKYARAWMPIPEPPSEDINE